MHLVFDGFTISNLVSVVIGLMFAVQGLGQLFTGKAYGKNWNQYTPESVKKAARPAGLVFLLLGIAFTLEHFLVFDAVGKETSSWIMLGVAMAMLIPLIIIYTVILKKKKA